MDNTYIFFTSDHGLSCGEHGLMGKQNMYDHSMRVPLMVIGPNIPSRKKIDADVYMQDIMATSLEIAGIPKPEYIEFNSFLNFTNGNQKESYYDGIYGTYEMKSQRMIRKDNYKLIVYPKSGKILLYDMKNDPLELEDISSEAVNSEKIKTLFKDLIELQDNMGDKLDLKTLYDNII